MELIAQELGDAVQWMCASRLYEDIAGDHTSSSYACWYCINDIRRPFIAEITIEA
jgi:hypothetical protein